MKKEFLSLIQCVAFSIIICCIYGQTPSENKREMKKLADKIKRLENKIEKLERLLSQSSRVFRNNVTFEREVKAERNFTVERDLSANRFTDRNSSYYADLDSGGKIRGDWTINNGSLKVDGEIGATRFFDKNSYGYYLELDTGANVKGNWTFNSGSLKVDGMIESEQFVDKNNSSYYADLDNGGKIRGDWIIEGNLKTAKLQVSKEIQSDKFIDSESTYYADLNQGGKLGGHWNFDNKNNRTTRSIPDTKSATGFREIPLTLEVNGYISAYGTLEPSDIRWKKKVKTLNFVLDKFQKIRGVQFEWKDMKNKNKSFAQGKQFGVIAQEVEKVIPELVATDKKGFKSVDYSKFIPFLIQAIKEQQEQIEQQQQQIELLQKN